MEIEPGDYPDSGNPKLSNPTDPIGVLVALIFVPLTIYVGLSGVEWLMSLLTCK